MSAFELGSGKSAFIDDIDLPLIEGRRWQEFNSCDGLKYVASARWQDGKLIWTFLHRLIFPEAEIVDHIDGDGLNNRRTNLRPCTHTENTQNRKRHSNNRSGFKGVYWHKQKQKWCANISAFGKRTVLGYFTDPKEAAITYDEAAVRLHGDFARLNFPALVAVN